MMAEHLGKLVMTLRQAEALFDAHQHITKAIDEGRCGGLLGIGLTVRGIGDGSQDVIAEAAKDLAMHIEMGSHAELMESIGKALQGILARRLEYVRAGAQERMQQVMGAT